MPAYVVLIDWTVQGIRNVHETLSRLAIRSTSTPRLRPAVLHEPKGKKPTGVESGCRSFAAPLPGVDRWKRFAVEGVADYVSPSGRSARMDGTPAEASV